MEAANRGAFEEGGTSYGLNIILPREQSPNPYVQKTVNFNYFFTRKVMLIKYSCAFIVMPGGLGTLDELFEAATLIQCKKIGPFPLVLMGTKFWKGLQTWGRHLMKHGVFEKEELGFGRREDAPTCRWFAKDLIVDLMPVDPEILGFSNKWYGPAVAHATLLMIGGRMFCGADDVPVRQFRSTARDAGRRVHIAVACAHRQLVPEQA